MGRSFRSDTPPKITIETKSGANIVIVELPTPPIFCLWTAEVPGTAQAIKYGLTDDCIKVIPAPQTNDPKRNIK